jgi:hypothetical protein
VTWNSEAYTDPKTALREAERLKQEGQIVHLQPVYVDGSTVWVLEYQKPA